MGLQYNTRYEIPVDEPAAGFIHTLTEGRMSPVIMIEHQDGQTGLGTLNSTDIARNELDADDIGRISCEDIVAVTMIDTDSLGSRADEIRPSEF